MGRRKAKAIIAEQNLTWGEILEVLKSARDAGANDDSLSIVNKQLSKHGAWRILYAATSKKPVSEIAGSAHTGDIYIAENVLREFGEFLS